MALLGVNSTLVPTEVNHRAVWDAACRYTVAQCLLDNIAVTESGLALRNIYPSLDLGAKTDSWAIKYPYVKAGDNYGYKIYEANRTNSWRDRTVITFYGICNLSLIKNRCHATRLIFKRANVKTIEILPLDEFRDGFNIISTPILYKKNDDIRIDVVIDEHASDCTEWLKLYGIVGEPLGMTVCG